MGLFIGCQPLYGLHFVLVLAVCLPLRLDAVLAYLAANISNPLLAPFLIVSEVEAGAYVTTGRFVAFDTAQAKAVGAAGFAEHLFVGSALLGALLAGLGFGVAWLVASRRTATRSPVPDDTFEMALSRTRARYETAPRGDRYYVAGKLAFDPVCQLAAELDGGLGRVLDLGCGRGQLSLLLLECGLASSVVGFDTDARKIEVAKVAGPEASFAVAELSALALEPSDTVLLIDVLHYLPLAEQDALLLAAAAALRPGGRLLVRELDAARTWRSALTRGCEWLARKVGLNRGRASAYRPAAELAALLERAGLRCEIQGASERTPFANVLIIAGGSPRTQLEARSSASSTRISAAKA
jgi:2-polyprenyl-3-methyl-5-hydroxy-6-metoxy-1,4-benzoquinol methylase